MRQEYHAASQVKRKSELQVLILILCQWPIIKAYDQNRSHVTIICKMRQNNSILLICSVQATLILHSHGCITAYTHARAVFALTDAQVFLCLPMREVPFTSVGTRQLSVWKQQLCPCSRCILININWTVWIGMHRIPVHPPYASKHGPHMDVRCEESSIIFALSGGLCAETLLS